MPRQVLESLFALMHAMYSVTIGLHAWSRSMGKAPRSGAIGLLKLCQLLPIDMLAEGGERVWGFFEK